MTKLDTRLIDIANAMKITISFTDEVGNGCYQPTLNRILLNYKAPHNTLNGVLAHELIHATGHPKHLNREIIKTLLQIGYMPLMSKNCKIAKQLNLEETIAERGAMLLCDSFGIDYNKNSMLGYIKRHDSEEYKKASIDFAKKAVNYILKLEERIVA